jgi:HSP20 family protein
MWLWLPDEKTEQQERSCSTMSLMRFDPERELLSLRDAMNRLMEESFVLPSIVGEVRGSGRSWGLAVDMVETNDQLVVKASVPGVKPEDLDVTVQGETLTIRGEAKEESEGQQGRYYVRERRQGSFSRTVTLPYPIQNDKVEASFENGVLTLTLPRAESVKPRAIKVQVKR